MGLDRSKPGQQLAPTLEQNTWNCMRWMQLVKRRKWAGDRRQCIFRLSMIRRGRSSYVVCRSSGSQKCVQTNRCARITRTGGDCSPRSAPCQKFEIETLAQYLHFFQSENLAELVQCKHRSSFICCLHVSFANCLRIGTEALNRRTDAAFVVDECGGQRFCGH